MISENNYLTVSEYAAIVGENVSLGQVFQFELALAKICDFGGIPTLTTSDCATATTTAFPVALLEALFELIAKVAPLLNREAKDH